MDGQLVVELYHELSPATGRRPRRGVHSDQLVVFLFLLACVMGRSTRFVLQRRNLPVWLRAVLPDPLPSTSCMSRRLRTTRAAALIATLDQRFRTRLPRHDDDDVVKVLDGKPLTVSAVSRDPDVTRGKVRDGWALGYKVHVLIDAATRAVDLFEVTTLSAGESTVAQSMLRQASEPVVRDALVLADANYDSNDLYTLVDDLGGRLRAPRRKPGTGLGHATHQHPHRLQAIEHLEGDPERRRLCCRHRMVVEQTLGHLTNLPCGLSPLPNFVRRLHRVRLWVSVKVLLYHAYLTLTYERSAAA